MKANNTKLISVGRDLESVALRELRSLGTWVGFRLEQRGAGMTKPPVDPKNGAYAKINDLSTFGTYEQAQACVQDGHAVGLGIVLTAEAGLIGIDIDHCIEDGVVQPWVSEILNLGETYAEFSLSGTGIHILARGSIPVPVVCGQAGIEIYSVDRYLTVSGFAVPGCPDRIREAPKTVDKLLKRVKLLRAKHSKGRGLKIEHAAPKRIEENFFRYVNDRALENLPAWVPDLLPAAKPTTYGYRVRSHDLGRDLDEDLSITSMGIKDFGVADLGDAQEGRRTPIDLVMEYADDIGLEIVRVGDTLSDSARQKINAKNASIAASYLAERLQLNQVMSSKYEWREDILLQAFNSTYCVVVDGGKTQVLSFEKRTVGASERSEAMFLGFDEFSKNTKTDM